MTQLKIKVVGLAEFQQAVRGMDAGAQRMVDGVLKEATGVVIDYARPRMPSRTGRARASLKAAQTRRDATVAIGGARAPYVPWLDFGGQGKRPGRPPARPWLKTGRYVYKALDVKRAEVEEILVAGLTQLALDAGLDLD
jgi:hypothetical protein